ncbi:MAG: hypothetical protein GXN98_04840 [Euryarchaeota archaeon]|nr:hypothetical protein [Euryarchaeota archaeon]
MPVRWCSLRREQQERLLREAFRRAGKAELTAPEIAQALRELGVEVPDVRSFAMLLSSRHVHRVLHRERTPWGCRYRLI